ncbi:MAG: hypothetical protein VYE22_23075 [Myxococcota bacterium]|nr:hypothetical protein [Myxococcota bacterium]
MVGLLAACGGEEHPSPRPPTVTVSNPPERGGGALAQSARASWDWGAIPDDCVVELPNPPRVRRTVHVRQPQRRLEEAGTRYLIHTDIDGRLDVLASDVELIVDEGVRIEELLIHHDLERVRVAGGIFGAIEIMIPGRFAPPPVTWNEDWLVEDVTIDGVTVESDDTAFAIRGRRVAILNSRATARNYSIWLGDTHTFQSHDLLVAGNRFRSAGPESTVRLVAIDGAIVVDNELANTRKHAFRIHGRSDNVYFARNRLVDTGVMIGSMDGDQVGSVWLVDNTVHLTVPSLLVAPPERIRRLTARGNRVFSDEWDCFVCARGDGWEIGDNPIQSYRAP